ncbi:MAG TPA: NAD(P)-dependent oxidoreductase, partial [Kineobactrum sp.]
MIRRLMLVPAIFALLLTSVAIAAEVTGTSATATVIDRLGLTPAPYPISTHPRWQPSRVVVSLPPQLGNNMPGYLLELQEAAGDATLVVDTSGAFVPTAETLAGADAYIGFCTTDMLANADKSLVWVHSYTVGMDRCSNADEALLGDRVFTNNKRLSGPTIAEHSIAMLLSISRGLPAYTAAQARSEWRPELAAQLEFGELGGKTMLIAGLGGIGTEIARRAHGLGMK